ncbi:6369_t:CDS:2, partial [Ambispora leptoticha]
QPTASQPQVQPNPDAKHDNDKPKIPITSQYTTYSDVCSDNPSCKTDTNKQDTGKTETIQNPVHKTRTTIPSDYDSKTITAFVTKVVTVTVTVYVPGYTTTLTDYKNGEPISYETYYPPSTKIILETVTSVAPAGFEFEESKESKAIKLGHY